MTQNVTDSWDPISLDRERSLVVSLITSLERYERTAEIFHNPLKLGHWFSRISRIETRVELKNSIIDIRFSKLDSGVAKHRFSILDPQSLWKALLAFLNLSLWNWLRLITFSFISLAYRWEHSKTLQQTVGWQTDVHVVGKAGFGKSFMVNTGVWGAQGVRSVQSNGRKDRKFVWWSD